MKKNNIILKVTAIMFTLMVTSCHNQLDTLPISSLSPDNFFNNLTESEIAVNGIYGAMKGTNDAYGQYYVQLATHGSHVVTNLSNQEPQNLYAQYTFDNSHKSLVNVWRSYYQMVFRANQAVDRISVFQVEDPLEEPLKNRLIAEAKFLRALAYFNLVRMWGDVPLPLTELVSFENTENYEKPRSPSSEVYDAIIADLQFAEQNLYHASWILGDQPSYASSDLGRATIGAAKGLLAKVYLTRASYPLKETSYYQDAYDKAKELIGMGYDLEPDYGNLFTVAGEDSHEWMFQVQFNAGQEQGNIWGGVNNPAGPGKAIDQGFGRSNPTESLIQSYDPSDPRFLHNIAQGKLKADNSIKFSPNQKLWFSYKWRFAEKAIGRFVTDMNAPVLRYADVLLVYAEAAANLELNSDAFDAIDLILDRARGTGVSPAPIDRTLSGDALLNTIMWERAKELCFEGTSKFDIVRMGEEMFLKELKEQLLFTNVDAIGSYVPVPWADKIQSKHLLFPIPEAEMASNPALRGDQNPGY